MFRHLSLFVVCGVVMAQSQTYPRYIPPVYVPSVCSRRQRSPQLK
jgi:hypothetical protein